MVFCCSNEWLQMFGDVFDGKEWPIGKVIVAYGLFQCGGMGENSEP